MIAQPQRDLLKMSSEEYLAWEAEQESKHEYENGTIIAMTGGTIPHSQVAANFAALLIPHLRGKGCKVAISDAKVATPSGKYYYPDLVVTCDERDRIARDYLQYPCLVTEVLSPATEARDRGIKQQSYMRIPTLQTYILIDPDRPQVETYQRQNHAWEYTLIGSADLNTDTPIVNIHNFDLEFPLALLYENINSDQGR